MKILPALLSLLLISFAGFSQDHEHHHVHHAGCEHGLIALEENAFSFVPPPADYEPGGERSVIISVTYNGFTPTAQTAFQYAVDIWASSLNSSVPILVNANFTNLGSGVLGSAGASNFYRNFSGAPVPNTYYPAALASSLAGSDLTVGFVDITANFNNSFNWYYGLDGNCPAGQYDFVSVVLHELCHGLGFVGSADVSGGTGFIGFNNSPAVYDIFVENGAGTDITSFADGSTALGNQLTGNSLYWNGMFGMDANGGNRPRIYAPGSWNGGSSYSHLNEGTYPSGSINSLMTPFIAAAEAIHDPGPIVLGMFADMGWSLDVTNCAITNVTVGTQSPCDPLTGTFTQELTIEYSEAPTTGDLIVNGQTFSITGSPQTVVLSSLQANGNPQNLNISFSDDPGCGYAETSAFTAPESCCTAVRILAVDPDNQQFTLKNFGQCSLNTINYILSSGALGQPISSMSIVSGSNFLTAGAEVTIQWNAWSPDPNGDDLALVLPGGDISDPADFVDYVQWLDSGNSSEALAVSAGIWGAGDFVFDVAPFDFLGGAGDYGVEFWDNIPPPCNISDVSLGTQTPCDGNSGNFTQEIIVSYSNEPATGTLRVNGVNFPITGSPQTVVLTLPATGLDININVFFSADPACAFAQTAFFSSPAPCSDCAIIDLTAGVQIPCFGNPLLYSQEVIVTYENPPTGSNLIVNGTSYPISGSPQSVTLLGISDGLPVDVTASFTFDSECTLTETALFTAALPCASCSIDNITVGTQSVCDPADNTYTQELTITYSTPPAGGSLVVNGQSFPISGSPQVVLLSGLLSDGNSVDVTAQFSAEPSCALSINSLFTAPASCDCAADINNDGEINVSDLLAILADTGCTSGCTADITGDDIVNGADLVLFLGVYGSSCP